MIILKVPPVTRALHVPGPPSLLFPFLGKHHFCHFSFSLVSVSTIKKKRSRQDADLQSILKEIKRQKVAHYRVLYFDTLGVKIENN